jgi:hypothetical protein
VDEATEDVASADLAVALSDGGGLRRSELEAAVRPGTV